MVRKIAILKQFGIIAGRKIILLNKNDRIDALQYAFFECKLKF